MNSIKAVVLLLGISSAWAGITDSSEWDTRFYMFPGPGLDGGLGAPTPIAAYPEGGFLTSGMFTNLGGTAVLNLARWNGANWVKPLEGQAHSSESAGDVHIAFRSSLDSYSGIYSIATHQASDEAPVELLIGGIALTKAGDTAIQNIAWWNGTNWHDLGFGTTGLVSSVIFDETGGKYAGGAFSSIGGVEATNVAYFNGTEWEPLHAGLPFAPDVLAIHEGALYAGGTAPADGSVGHGLLRWDGSDWLPLAEAFPSGSGGRIFTMLSTAEGLYVAGSFTNIGSVTATNVALWNGTEWQALGDGLPARTFSIAMHDGRLVAAGRYGSPAIRGLAKWDGTNWMFETDRPTIAAKTVAVNGSEILTRGQIDNGLDAPPRGAAYFDGSAWRPIGQGLYESLLLVENSRIIHLIPHEQDLVFAATWPFASQARMVRWDGTVWSMIGQRGQPFPRRFNSIYSQAGNLWVSTATTGWVTPGGTRIAATDGTNWHAATQAFSVNAIVAAGAKVFAGGNNGLFEWNGTSYSQIEGFTNAVVSLATDGNTIFVATVPSFGGSVFSVSALENGERRELASSITNRPYRFELAYLNGALHAYGSFTNINGKPLRAVARWDGQDWQEALPSHNNLLALSLAGDGRDTLFVGGVHPVTGTNLLQVRDGNVTGLKMAVNTDTVEAMAWWKGALYIAGPFSTIAGVQSEVIGAWHDPDAAVEVIVQAPTNTLAGGTATVNLGVHNLRATNLDNVRLSLPLAPGATPVELPDGATIEGTNVVLQIPTLAVGSTNIALNFNLSGPSGTNVVFYVIAEGDGIPTFRSAPAATTVFGGNLPPLVTLGAIPQTATLPVSVTISATASDTDGTIARVEFYANAELIGIDSEAPFELEWTPGTTGNYLIYAIAHDNLESQTVSLSKPMVVRERPANDAYENRIIVTNSVIALSGTLLEATQEPGDPEGFGKSVWYEWQPRQAGIAEIWIAPVFLQVAVYRNSTNEAPVAYSASNVTLPIRLVTQGDENWIIAVGGNSERTFDLQLKVSPAQAHDFFANAKTLEGWEVQESIDTFGMTAEEGEPAISGEPAEKTLWFSWTAPADGRVVFVPSLIRLGFWQGTNLASLQAVPVTVRDPNLPPGWADYPVVAGERYYLQADQSFSFIRGGFSLDLVTQGGRIRSMGKTSSGEWRFEFRSYDYNEYVVEKSNNLIDWEIVQTFVAGAQSSDFTIPASSSENVTFWRTRYSRPHPGPGPP